MMPITRPKKDCDGWERVVRKDTRQSKADFRSHAIPSSPGLWATLVVLAMLPVKAEPSVADWSSETHRWRLDNGMTVLFRHNPVSQTVAMAAFVRVPVTAERADQAGIRHLVQSMLVYRSPEIEDLDPVQQLGRHGAVVATFVDYDSTQVTVAGLAEYFDSYLPPLRDILFGEQFAWEHFGPVRAAGHSMLQASRENAVGLAVELAHERLFAGMPGNRLLYGLYGTEASLQRLRQADVRIFHAQYWRPNNVVLSISGPMTADQCHRQVEAAFALTLPGVATDLLQSPSQEAPSAYVYRPWPTPSAVLLMLGRAPAPWHESYAATQVLTAIIGGGQGSLLWQALRENEPLAYAIDAVLSTSSVASTLQIVAVCEAAQAQKVSEIVSSRIKALRDAPLSNEQVAAAIGYIQGRYLSQQQSNLEVALAMGRLEAMAPDRGLELHTEISRQIRGVTPRQVQDAARFCTTNAVLVQLGGVPPGM